jgi:3-hydroxyacyl-[acyl-carrier-protein] dehydratase
VPAAPLIEIGSLDLSRTVAGEAEIRKLCLQRNRFAMLDRVVHFDPDSGISAGVKELATSDWWAEDHIPGRPIFPGALQIEGAAQLCTFHFLTAHPEQRGKFVGFGGLDETRFRGVVTPPARMVFVAKELRFRPTMFTYAAQGFVDGKQVLETEILGVIV